MKNHIAMKETVIDRYFLEDNVLKRKLTEKENELFENNSLEYTEVVELIEKIIFDSVGKKSWTTPYFQHYTKD